MSHRLPDNPDRRPEKGGPEKGGEAPFSPEPEKTGSYPSPAERDGRGYEIRDARPRSLLMFAIYFVAGLVVVHLIGWTYLRSFLRDLALENRTVHAAPPVARFGIVPPAPGVQPEPGQPLMPSEELAQVRSREAAMLGSNAQGWVDAEHRFTRIPLQRAIDLAVRDGLPEKLPATQPTTQPFMPPASAEHGPGGVP
ncbi:MAG TPA: hypothetical protein VH370_27605 [Humisphaera sp.]|jgi:hypothetical protein|nr:hypothetical protein [Humisphaera sp.]